VRLITTGKTADVRGKLVARIRRLSTKAGTGRTRSARHISDWTRLSGLGRQLREHDWTPGRTQRAPLDSEWGLADLPQLASADGCQTIHTGLRVVGEGGDPPTYTHLGHAFPEPARFLFLVLYRSLTNFALCYRDSFYSSQVADHSILPVQFYIWMSRSRAFTFL